MNVSAYYLVYIILYWHPVALQTNFLRISILPLPQYKVNLNHFLRRRKNRACARSVITIS